MNRGIQINFLGSMCQIGVENIHHLGSKKQIKRTKNASQTICPRTSWPLGVIQQCRWQVEVCQSLGLEMVNEGVGRGKKMTIF